MIVEAQSKKDTEKPVSWAYYLSYLASKYKTHQPTLLVVCRDKATADWAAGPFPIGRPGRPNLLVSSLVLGPDNVPVVTDVTRAAEDLPLAVFSALTHSADDRIGEILEALASALKQTADGDIHPLLRSHRERAERVPSSRTLEAPHGNRTLRPAWLRRRRAARRRARRRATPGKGRAAAPPDGCARDGDVRRGPAAHRLQCRPQLLDLWLGRALTTATTATTAEDVFGEADGE